MIVFWLLTVESIGAFIDNLFHALGNSLLGFELRETKMGVNERSNNGVYSHIAVTETYKGVATITKKAVVLLLVSLI